MNSPEELDTLDPIEQEVTEFILLLKKLCQQIKPEYREIINEQCRLVVDAFENFEKIMRILYQEGMFKSNNREDLEHKIAHEKAHYTEAKKLNLFSNFEIGFMVTKDNNPAVKYQAVTLVPWVKIEAEALITLAPYLHGVDDLMDLQENKNGDYDRYLKLQHKWEQDPANHGKSLLKHVVETYNKSNN